MTKSLSASSDIMQNYLSELLTDDSADSTWQKTPVVVTKTLTAKAENQHLDKLLQSVSEQNVNEVLKQSVRTSSVDEVAEKPKQKAIAEELVVSGFSTRKSEGVACVAKQQRYRKGNFQAMFFDVAGLIIAVPLIELGGIHNAEKTTSLMGKPNWFKGVMLNRGDKVNVVDTALWVMPEKCNDKLINSLNYQYVIMLGNSTWGLMAELLVDTVTLAQYDVKWLDKPSKRPWLAGLVKERMCALLNVEALIKLLDEGSGIL